MMAKIEDNALFSALRSRLFMAVVGDVLIDWGGGGNFCCRQSAASEMFSLG